MDGSTEDATGQIIQQEEPMETEDHHIQTTGEQSTEKEQKGSADVYSGSDSETHPSPWLDEEEPSIQNETNSENQKQDETQQEDYNNDGNTSIDEEGVKNKEKEKEETCSSDFTESGDSGDTEPVSSGDENYHTPLDSNEQNDIKKPKKKASAIEEGFGKDEKKEKDKSLSKGKESVKKQKHKSESSGASWPWSSWSFSSSKPRKIVLPKLNRHSSDDTEEYRMRYPGKPDNPRITENYEFYTNQIPSYPQGDYIDRIHQSWKGNYGLLEYHHSYIQWLFPIRERGLNWHAKELQLHEIEAICEDREAHERVIRSYEMMLDFYGLRLKDRQTGEVERSDNWEDRFDNLNHSSHNYLRITRILKCLGEFKLEHYKSPLIKCFLHEAITTRKLYNIFSSCMNYWVGVVRCDDERRELRTLAQVLVDEANSKIKD